MSEVRMFPRVVRAGAAMAARPEHRVVLGFVEALGKVKADPAMSASWRAEGVEIRKIVVQPDMPSTVRCAIAERYHREVVCADFDIPSLRRVEGEWRA